MHIVIIGAGYAGLSCALRLARTAPRSTEITLINAGAQFVERIRLHEQTAGTPPRALPLTDLVRGTRVRLRIGWAQHIDLAAHTLVLGMEVLHWERLVLALGSYTDLAQTEGVREHAYTLDAASRAWLVPLVPALAARRGRVIVVGGGLTGIEVATELADRQPGLRVALVTRGELAAGISSPARAYVRASALQLGVEVHEHVSVRSVRARELVTDDGVMPFDACIWSAGFSAAPLARTLGLAVNERGQVWVDRTLRSTSHRDVYAVGDLAALAEPCGAPMPMGCKSALPAGLHAADNLVRSMRGVAERPFLFPAVPYCISFGRRAALLAQPTRTVPLLTGMPAARLKELICRGTLWSLRLERWRAAPVAGLRGRSKPLLSSVASTREALP